MIVGLPLGHSRGVGDYRGRSWRDYLMVEDTGDPRSIARGPRFDCERDVTEQAGPPTEERCHNVAKTGVDSGRLQETGGDNRMAGT